MSNAIVKSVAHLIVCIRTFAAQLFQFLCNIFGVNSDTKSSRKGTSLHPTENDKVKGIKDLPGPISIPYLGTLLMDSLNPLDLKKANEDTHRKYGPIYKHEYFGNFPLIVINQADDMELVYKNAQLLRPPMQMLTVYRERRRDRYDSIGIVNINGESWHQLRKVTCTQAMSTVYIKSLVSDLDRMAADWLEGLPKVTGGVCTLLNAAPILYNFIGESAFFMTMGARVGFLEKNVSKKLKSFIKYHDQYWKAFHSSQYGFPWWKYFPTKSWREFTSAEDNLYALIQQIAMEVAVQRIPGPGIMYSFAGLSEADYKTSIMEMLMGATEPILHMLILTICWVSKYGDIQAKVHDELKSVLSSKETRIDEFNLKKLVYLKACMMETFRICPVTPNLARILESELKIQGYTLPQYSVIICQSWYTYLQEENFYKASEFLPERWLTSENGEPRFHPHRGNIVRPFGAGKRACPGQKFAMHAVQIFLAKLFRTYKVKLIHDVQFQYEFMMVADSPVDLELIEYND